jgi:hypothetical protein
MIPDVSIIIVSWNVAADLAACLRSIDAAPKPVTEIIVVDSASADETVSMLRRDFPHVVLFAQTENVGFTKGNNIGLRAARGRCLFLLNPDTEIIGDAITRMMAYLDANPHIAMIGAHTLNSDGTYQPTRRHFPTLASELIESIWFAPRLKRLPSHFPLGQPDPDSTHEVDWVQGSALMARRAVYEHIGGLDEQFFMFSEEVDWCKRACLAGWKTAYVGNARIVHHGGRSTEQTGAHVHIYYQVSKIRYFKKHHGALSAQILRWYILANYAIQWIIESTKSALGHRPDMRRARIQRYRAVLRSGLREA